MFVMATRREHSGIIVVITNKWGERYIYSDIFFINASQIILMKSNSENIMYVFAFTLVNNEFNYDTSIVRNISIFKKCKNIFYEIRSDRM